MRVAGVGSGKSSLALALLGEVPQDSGRFAVYGRVAYASQSAWILSGLASSRRPGRFARQRASCRLKKKKPRLAVRASGRRRAAAGTVRDNILFGLPFEAAWYDRVVKACALDRDFALFPNGDETSIGERGVTLSGGQRARVRYARRAMHWQAHAHRQAHAVP